MLSFCQISLLQYTPVGYIMQIFMKKKVKCHPETYMKNDYEILLIKYV